MCWLTRLFTAGLDKPSASDIVLRESIGAVYSKAGALVTIDLAKPNIPFTLPPQIWIPEIPDTNSMDPSFDFGHNNILIAGANEENQKILVDFIGVGDIAVYRIPPDYNQPSQFYAIHRIVEIGWDAEGRYFIFQGDNCGAKDPYKARNENILWLCIGTIF